MELLLIESPMDISLWRFLRILMVNRKDQPLVLNLQKGKGIYLGNLI